jgi:CYTH domain-containing protein
MADEVERKYVVTAPLPPDVAAHLGRGVAIRQGYLAEEGDVSMRLRLMADTAVLTVKAGSGLRRTEVEVALSDDDGAALWPYTAGRRIAKTRYRIALADGLVAELDEYGGDLAGLSTVEVEFESEVSAAAFAAPQWFGREVTGDHRWSNAALARHGLPR